MSDPVSLKVLQNIHLENFLEKLGDKASVQVRTDIDPKSLVDIFLGSDLKFDPQKKLLIKPGEAPRSLFEEVKWIDFIRASDLNKDGQLDVQEMYVALRNNSSSEKEAKEIDPQAYLNSIAELIKVRYAPISKNLNAYRADTLFQPMLQYLRTYSKGIQVDQSRHAQEVLPFNAWTKSASNVLGVFYTIPKKIFAAKSQQVPFLFADSKADALFKDSHQGRLKVIERLGLLIKEGVGKEEKWALEGDFKTAVSKLKDADQKVIRDQLAGLEFFDILTISDDGTRYRKLFDFAKKELPGFLGIGGGNSKRSTNLSFWNYTGAVNNLYAARAILGFLVSKAQVWRPYSGQVSAELLKNGEVKTGEEGKLFKLDKKVTEALQNDARQLRIKMMGDGGGFANFIECHVPGLKIECRVWGDEAKIGIPGRMLEMGLLGYTTYRGIGHLGNTWEVARLKGAGEPFRVWWQESWSRPFATKAMKDARALAVQEVAAAEQAGTVLPKPPWLGNRVWNAVKKFSYDHTVGRFSELSAAQKARMAAAPKAAGKGIVALTNAVLITGVTSRADKKVKADFNPFELNYEFDVVKNPDPTQPDPILSAKPGKK